MKIAENLDLNRTIGLKIKSLREGMGKKQDELAQKLGITQEMYSKLENGHAEISLTRLADIANALEISAKDIINFDEKNIFNNYKCKNAYNGIINLADRERENCRERIDELKSVYEKQIADLQKQVATLQEKLLK